MQRFNRPFFFFPREIIHDTGPFLPFFRYFILCLDQRFLPEVGSIDICQLFEEFVAKGEDKMFLHFLPVSFDKDATVSRKD
jgi:hypothetical protein